VFFGEIPLMTDNGISSSMEPTRDRQPVCTFAGHLLREGQQYTYFLASHSISRLMVEFEYDTKNLFMSGLTASEILGTVFLRALGLMEKIDLDRMGSDSHLEDEIKRSSFSDAEILRSFTRRNAPPSKAGICTSNQGWAGWLALAQAVEDRAGEVIVKGSRKLTGATLRAEESQDQVGHHGPQEIEGHFLPMTVVNPKPVR